MRKSLKAGLKASLVLPFMAIGIGHGLGAESLAAVRASADGAGPSHLFWLAGPSAGSPQEDVIGVVDPLLAAIRLYAVRRQSQSAEPFPTRFRELGACSLPIELRPWRIHHFASNLHIEGMPKPSSDGQNTKSDKFSSPIYVISRDILANGATVRFKAAADKIDQPSWDPKKAPACGSWYRKPDQADSPPSDEAEYGQVDRLSPVTALRGTSNPSRTILLSNKPDALAPQPRLTVRAPSGGAFRLYSATELEPAGDLRIVQITEGLPGNDGVARLFQRILVFSRDGSGPHKEFRFDETLLRSKLPQRALAVLPTGELLAMGREPEEGFRIQSCGFLNRESAGSAICRNADEGVASRNAPDLSPVTQPLPPSQPASSRIKNKTAKLLFSRISRYVNHEWEVDTIGMPENCRSVTGCGKTKPYFVPIRGIRLTRGIHRQTGVPYAMTPDLRPADEFLRASQGDLTRALNDALQGAKKLPGNLNDNFDGDLGLDCSGLVQLSWIGHQAPRLSTYELQKRGASYVCRNRLPNTDYLRPGDAIGINVKPGPNHVVLFAAALRFDGANDAWLVLESASGCDGVCWSVYDAAFFNGWGLYRTTNRSDASCIPTGPSGSIATSPIPTNLEEWRALVNKKKM